MSVGVDPPKHLVDVDLQSQYLLSTHLVVLGHIIRGDGHC